MIIRYLLCLLCCLLSSCAWHPGTAAYKAQYEYLATSLNHAKTFSESEYFLVILVEARHLDYSNNNSFFKTLVKHPSDGSKNSDVGHAWVFLKGKIDELPVFLEGGHSGELGFVQPKYFEGVVDLACRGDDNPVRYLWAIQKDGFFQRGSGGHSPTFAAKVAISQKQFDDILNFIQKYPYHNYSIVQNQCSTFVTEIAQIAGLKLESFVTMDIASSVQVFGERLTLWTDPQYSTISFASPDKLEKSLIQAVKQKNAEDARVWYKKNVKTCPRKKWNKRWESIKCFPQRFLRFLGC